MLLAITKALEAEMGEQVDPMSPEEISEKTGISIEEIKDLESTALNKLKKAGITEEMLESIKSKKGCFTFVNPKDFEKKSDDNDPWKKRLNYNK